MKKFLPIFLGVALYITFVFFTYKFYAITSDEFSSYISGQMWSEYFQNKDISYYLARYHPLVNEHYRFYSMILFMLVGSVKYEVFHLLSGLAFIPVLITAYVLSKYTKAKSIWAQLIPAIFILLTPRILGDIFNNPKDIPFAILYFVSLALIFISKENSDKWNNHLKIILLGVLIGFSQSFRPLGFALYIIYFLWNLPQDKKSIKAWGNLFLETLNIAFIGFLVMAVTWPAIGANFAANLKKYLSLGVDFNLWEGEVFYFGKKYAAQNLPWHYLFVWILITLPISHLILVLTGFISLIRKKATKLQKYLYGVVGLNVILYFILKPSLYNGIRHYDFLILILAFLAGVNFLEFVNTASKKATTIVAGLLIVYLLITIFTTYRLFPFPNLYFNELAGGPKNSQKYFDFDYWDTTYLLAVPHLKDQIKENEKLYSCGSRRAMEYYLNKKVEQTRNVNEAAYIVCDVEGYKELEVNHKILTTVEKAGIPLIVISKQ